MHDIQNTRKEENTYLVSYRHIILIICVYLRPHATDQSTALPTLALALPFRTVKTYFIFENTKIKLAFITEWYREGFT
jgi:hypothetical protein